MSTEKRKIKLLPDFLANQIAAGEVVQRPESVVKELVENAIDARAQTITVIVKDSGKSLIHIIDDGEGMDREDLLLSIKRHATSKISTQADLEAIGSFGFRGEALASISSVARLEILSNQSSEQEHGLRLIAEPNKEADIEPALAPKGTQILVRNLFYNVPARRKFLRSNITEFRHISDTVIKTALSHPERRVVFYDDDTLVFDSPSGDLDSTIVDVLGKGFRTGLIQLQQTEEDGIGLGGYISELNSFRSTRTNQYIFLNRRPIKSKSLAHAIMTAYEPFMAKGQHAAYILNITIDPKRVDINIHPQKHEVKFENEKKIYDLVLESVSRTLDTGGYMPVMKEAGGFSIPAKLPHSSIDIEGKKVLVNTDTGEIVPTRRDWSQGGEYKRFGSDKRDYTPPKPDFGKWERGSERQDVRAAGGGNSLADLIYGGEGANVRKESFNLDAVYHVMVDSLGIRIFNLSNIWDAFLFRKIKDGKLGKAQDLMFPLEQEISDNGRELVNLLLELGCIIDHSDGKAIIQALPPELSAVDFESLFREGQEMIEGGESGKRRLAESIVKVLPRRSSFSSNEREELRSFALANPDLNLSPRGKRLYKLLDKDIISSWF